MAVPDEPTALRPPDLLTVVTTANDPGPLYVWAPETSKPPPGLLATVPAEVLPSPQSIEALE